MKAVAKYPKVETKIEPGKLTRRGGSGVKSVTRVTRFFQTCNATCNTGNQHKIKVFKGLLHLLHVFYIYTIVREICAFH